MAYTDEELLGSLRQLADTVGETPTTSQCNTADVTPSARTYRVRFGSWNDALEAAGLDMNEQKSHTDDELLTILQEFAAERGETPTRRQCDKADIVPSSRTYGRRFGSWNDALEAAELSLNREETTPLTDAELMRQLAAFADRIGETPTIKTVRETAELPSTSSYETRFGSWNAALRAAGLSINLSHEQSDATDEELLDMLCELAAEHDTSPTQDDVDFAPDLPNAAVFAHRFGGWNEAKQQAGLSTHNRPNHYTETELIQKLRHVSQTVETPLTYTDMNEAGGPSSATYTRRFGSWTNALEKAGLVESQETPPQ